MVSTVNPDWLIPWLKNPRSSSRDDDVLAGGHVLKSPYPDFGGDGEAQIQAVVAHR
jgi:hypothetical protein